MGAVTSAVGLSAWGRLAAVGLAILLALGAIGCGGRSGGAIQESDEFSFDEIAAAAAAETRQSEAGSQ